MTQVTEVKHKVHLQYCHLLTKGYSPARSVARWRHNERYMCSRFFIDFPDVSTQEQKLISYLSNHLVRCLVIEAFLRIRVYRAARDKTAVRCCTCKYCTSSYTTTLSAS